jgi:hypothetical protein
VLGRDLQEWRYWSKFVDGFHPRLFWLSGIAREDLRRDSSLLKPFAEWICSEQDRRTFTGISRGEADLVDSAAAEKKRQTELAAKLVRFENKEPTDSQVDRELERVFPELAE